MAKARSSTPGAIIDAYLRPLLLLSLLFNIAFLTSTLLTNHTNNELRGEGCTPCICSSTAAYHRATTSPAGGMEYDALRHQSSSFEFDAATTTTMFTHDGINTFSPHRTLLSSTSTSGVERSPDWSLLGIMLLLIFGLISLIVLGLYFFQTHSWGNGNDVANGKLSNSSSRIPAYRREALHESLDIWNVFVSKGTIRSIDNVSKGLTSLQPQDQVMKEALMTRAGGMKASTSDGDNGTASGHGGVTALNQGSDVASQMSDWENAQLGDDENDQYMNELSSHLDLEGFDFHSLYKMLDETKASVESHFEHQEDGLKIFYERMSMEIDHLKNILAVKMQVQLNKTGEGMSEAVDRLVSGELLARQSFQDLSRRRELELTKTLEQLVTSIRNLNEDYNLFPIKELVRLTNEYILYSERGLEQERNRRKIFASHTEIVGRPIIDALAKADLNEENTQDSYLASLKMFEGSVEELIRKIVQEEQNHASTMEKLDESSTDKRKLEMDRFHLAICKLTKQIQQQLSYLDENLTPIFEGLREMEDRTHHVWVYVQGELLEERWTTLLQPVEGKLFRGINPELAKVLTGLLGMKGGLMVDPVSGTLQPKTPFDPTDPFDTIFDYQVPVPVIQTNQDDDGEMETDSDEEGANKKRRKKKLGKKKKRTDSTVTSGDDLTEKVEEEDEEHEEDEDATKDTTKDETTDATSSSTADAEEPVVLRRKKTKEVDAEDDSADVMPSIAESSSDDGTAPFTTTTTLTAEEEEDAAVTAGITTDEPIQEDDVRTRALADLAAKRKAIEEDEALTELSRQTKLAALDNELSALKKIFGEDTTSLLDAFHRSQQGRSNEIDEDEAEIARLKAELDAKHAELQRMEDVHTQEEDALRRQMDREDAEAAESFAVDMSKFDTLLAQLNDGNEEGEEKKSATGEAGDAAAASSSSKEDDSSSSEATKKEYREASSTLLNEYEFLIHEGRNKGTSNESIKEEMSKLQQAKRAALREKRLDALKKKQINESEVLKVKEEEVKENLCKTVKEQEETQVVLEVLNMTKGSSEPGASSSSSSSSSSSAAASSSSTTKEAAPVIEAPISAEVAASYSAQRASIERRFKRSQLDREARNTVQEAMEFVKLEFRQDALMQKKLRAKRASVTLSSAALSVNVSGSAEEGKANEAELQAILKAADADRDSFESAQEYERARQKKKLQDAMEQRKKNQREKAQKKKEMELRQATRQAEEGNKSNQIEKEYETISTAVTKLPETDRKKLGRKIIELVMAGRHTKETENILTDHLEERQAFVLESMESATQEEKEINFMQIEQDATVKFDKKHAHDVAILSKQQLDEVKQSYQKLFNDESVAGPEWEQKDIDELHEYQRKRREVMQRKALIGKELSSLDDELAKMSADAEKKQEAHNLRLKQEQEEFDRMQSEFDAKEEIRKKKRAQLEEEQKKRELALADDLSDAQREDILKQHRLNLKNFERASENEKMRQASALEKALEERRRKIQIKKAQQKAAIEKQKTMQREIAKREKKKLLKKLKDEQVNNTANDVWKLRGANGGMSGMRMSSSSSLASSPRAGAGVDFFTGSIDENDSGAESDDGATRTKKRLEKEEAARKEVAQKQEVLARLKNIETMVEKMNTSQEKWRSQAYHDEKDSTSPAYQQHTTNGEVIPCALNELDSKSLVLYRYGVQLISLLSMKGLIQNPASLTSSITNKPDSHPITLLLANSFPLNPHTQTAYSKSWYYQVETQTLFIRKERLQDVGEFILVLIHCVAHVSASVKAAMSGGAGDAVISSSSSSSSSTSTDSSLSPSIWDDRTPLFQQTFHSLLKFICSDIFYASANKALVVAPGLIPLVNPTHVQQGSEDGGKHSNKGSEGEMQIEGATNGTASSSSSSSSSSPSSTSSSPDSTFGQSVRSLAIDELLDFHPLSGLDGSHSNGATLAGIHHSHHASSFSTARMLDRMSEYQAFVHASALKTNLVELEQNIKQREHAREVKEARSFRQRTVRGVPAPTSNEDKSWQQSGERIGRTFDLVQLQNIEDDLTEELCRCAEQLHIHTHALQQAERDIKELKSKVPLGTHPSQDQLNTISKLDTTVVNEKITIGQLGQQKDHFVGRLRNVTQAIKQCEGEEKEKEDD